MPVFPVSTSAFSSTMPLCHEGGMVEMNELLLRSSRVRAARADQDVGRLLLSWLWERSRTPREVREEPHWGGSEAAKLRTGVEGGGEKTAEGRGGKHCRQHHLLRSCR